MNSMILSHAIIMIYLENLLEKHYMHNIHCLGRNKFVDHFLNRIKALD